MHAGHCEQMENQPVSIRGLRSTDLDDFVDIHEQPRVIHGTLQLPLQSSDRRRERFERMLGDPNTHALGAEVDGRLVGTLSLHCTAKPRTRHIADLGMVVHDDFQGRGIGTALMRAAVDLCDKWLAIDRISLDVYVDNEPAIALYKRFDFEIEGTLRRRALRDGVYVDAYAMARLRPGLD